MEGKEEVKEASANKPLSKQATPNGRPMPGAPQPSNDKRWHFWAAIAALVIVPFILYYPSLHAPFIFDDITYIVENPRIQNWFHQSTLRSYELEQGIIEKIQPARWITFFTFALNYRFGGLNTFGYHLFNLAIHLINVSLVFLLARILLTIANAPAFVAPFLAALLFAVHPMNTEVVSYVSHRSEGLAAMFYLISVLLFIEAAKGKKLNLYLSLISFTIGFFSKEIAITLPLSLLTVDYLFISDMNGRQILIKWKVHLPYWMLLLGFVIYRQVSLGGVRDYADATSLRWNQVSYLVVQPMVILQYLQLLLLPVNQCIDHFVLPLKSAWNWKFIVPTISICGVVPSLFFLHRKKTPTSKLYLFSILWFFVILIPTSILP